MRKFKPQTPYRQSQRMGITRPERFKRANLPPALEYYRRELGRLHGYGEWRAARCPFHDDRAPSLGVNIRYGGYRCHGCGEHGGDILAFHRRLYGLDFISAARALGAWEGRS